MAPLETSSITGTRPSLARVGGLVAAAVLATSFLASNAGAQASQRSKLGSDPRVSGVAAVIPVEDDRISRSTDFVPEFHGFMRAPLQLSMGSRENPAKGQSGTTLHTPGLAPDLQFGSWLLTNNAPGTWAAWTFSYGNKYASGTVGIGAYNFAPTQSAGGVSPDTINGQQSVIFGPVFVSLANPDLMDGKVRVDLNVGSFMNRYGLAGKYDWGKYLMFAIGGTAQMGYSAGIEMDVSDDITVRAEQGFGANNFPNLTSETGPVGTTLVAHGHAILAYRQALRVGLHGFHAFMADDRINPSDGTGGPDGSQTIFGGDMRFNGEGAIPGVYLAYSMVGNDHVANVAPVLQVANVNGGIGFIDNYLGRESNGNGTVHNFSGQIDYDVANLFFLPDSWDRSSPNIELTAFWLFTAVKADTAPGYVNNPWDGVNKLKFGAEAMYMVAPWFSAGLRYDNVMPNMADSEQSFMIFSPKINLKSNWFTNEKIIIQYSRYMYGNKAPLAPEVFNNVTGEKLVPITSPGSGNVPYDSNLLYIAAEMYW